MRDGFKAPKEQEADYENLHSRNPLPDDSGRHYEPTSM